MSQQAVIVNEERYCGPLSWIIGCFLFPCICFCPIDKKQKVTYVGNGAAGTPVVVKTNDFGVVTHTQVHVPAQTTTTTTTYQPQPGYPYPTPAGAYPYPPAYGVPAAAGVQQPAPYPPAAGYPAMGVPAPAAAPAPPVKQV